MMHSSAKKNGVGHAIAARANYDTSQTIITDIVEVKSGGVCHRQEGKRHTRMQSKGVKCTLEYLNSSLENLNEAVKASHKSFDNKIETMDHHLIAVQKESVKLANVQFSATAPSTPDSDSSSADIAMHDTMITKIDELNKQITRLVNDVEGIKTSLENYNKHQMFEKMILSSDCGSFSYYEGSSDVWEDSADIVCMALKWFALGHGCNIRDDYTTEKDSTSEDGRKDFRTKFSTQLTDIMGHKPRFVKSDDSSYDVFYS
eukprot:CAMPEP_0204634284 /NCGR_PEP_ID=MMETSP0717-20131115/28874_1 /ASSEMBLY_ACC=CAM_ASM_000666 /TAXON_ID=230516 /ORGANISM="Chaetoceros curvisetus" /LENGTH=258 /DNA_ID=CAMNT_0051652675 /DNA_START=209 /DNA_END=985 /DNA_ORIENTATION=+